MEGEDLHAWLSVRVVSWLELELGHTEFLEELVEDADEIAQGQVAVSYDSLDLMELGQMGCVQSLITEYFVNREVFGRFELFLKKRGSTRLRYQVWKVRPWIRLATYLLRQLVQHTSTHGGRVGSQNVLLTFF